MATHAVLIPLRIAATSVDAYNRSAIAGSTVDLDNANVFRLDSKSSASATEYDVFAVTACGSASLNNLWMQNSPEIVLTVSGTKQYRGIDPDPRDFYTPGGKVLDAFKPVAGDLLRISADAFVGSQAAFANATTGSYVFTWGASQTASAFSMKYLGTTYASIGSGGIDSQRITMYDMEVISN